MAVFADGEKVGLVAVLRGLPERSTKESLLRLKKLLGERKMVMVSDNPLSPVEPFDY